MLTHIKQAFLDNERLIHDFYSNEQYLSLTAKIAEKLAIAINSGNKIMLAGNGGSACDAMHFAEECTGRFRNNRKAFPVMTFSDVGHITCVANDFGFEQVFAKGLEAFAKPNDWFIALSTSGNSTNIINAIKLAKTLKVPTLALLGKDGGKIAGTCDYEYIIPGTTADRIQEIHMVILHVLVECIERQLFPENYN